MAEDISAVGNPYNYAYVPATPPVASNARSGGEEAAEPVADNEVGEQTAPAALQTLNTERANSSTVPADLNGQVTPTETAQAATGTAGGNAEAATPGAMLDLYV